MQLLVKIAVTPLAGVWIEIMHLISTWQHKHVTPLAGVWIEIEVLSWHLSESRSLPLRECGLKSITSPVV